MNRLERLRQLLESGSLAASAAASPNQRAWLAGLGISEKMWGTARKHAVAGGEPLPTYWELRARGGANAGDFEQEDPTQPGVEHVPGGHYMRGQSTLEDGSGNVVLRWTKTAIGPRQHLEQLAAAMREQAADWRGATEPIEPPQYADDDLLAMYVIGDPHIGMHAWPEETGDAFDLELAEQHICTAVDHLVGVAPAASRGLLVVLGDNVHADGMAAATTAGTRVDVDTRWAKVMRVAIRTIRRAIELGLQKHQEMDVIIEGGNHDAHSSIMLAICLAQFYERETRVRVDTSPAKFHYHRFGTNLIGVTHGDTCKPDRLPAVMACDRAADWGETVYRKWIVGHVHHSSVKEHPGCTVETYPTLAPKDAWHAAAGYRSSQSMALEVLHRVDGPINKSTIGIRQVKRLVG